MKCSPFRCARLATFAIALFVTLPQLVRAQITRPLGIDVSSFQGSAQTPPTHMNWPSVKSAGITFAWCKCAEGNPANGYHLDADFAYNEANAKSAGVLIGAYYFAHPDSDLGLAGADTEAGIFWNDAKAYLVGGGGYLMPMLDYETSPGSSYTKSTSSQWVNRWCQDIVNFGTSNGVALKPIVYTYVSFATTWLDTTVTNWPLWMAQYPGGTPNPQTGGPSGTSPWPGGGWTFWQYSSTNKVSGVNGDVDVDVFKGDSNSLVAYIISGPSITNQPASITVSPGANVTFSVLAGPAPLHYQWKYNGATISGATNTNYSVFNVQLTNAGYYTVLVTNTAGSVLSAAAILSVVAPQTNFPATTAVAPANLANWWAGEGNCLDIFGAANGAPTGDISFPAGEVGQTLHFDGSSAIITTGAADLGVPWTLSLWVNRQNTPQVSAGIVEDGTYSLKLEQYNGTHDVGLSVLGVGDYLFSPTYSVPVNTWTHLAFVGTSSGTSLYVNGAFKASLTNSIPLPRNYLGGAYISSSAKYVDFMLGSMDEIMTFSRALSATEINNIYQAGQGGLLRAPQITDGNLIASNQFQLLLRGLTGKLFFVQSSTDLVTWKSLGPVSGAAGTNQYTDSNATNTQTFYRVYQP